MSLNKPSTSPYPTVKAATQPKRKRTLEDIDSRSKGQPLAQPPLSVQNGKQLGLETLFTSEMKEKEVRIKLFILEDEPGFSQLEDRGKFNAIIKKCSPFIQ